jgi:hypothetical protein
LSDAFFQCSAEICKENVNSEISPIRQSFVDHVEHLANESNIFLP